MSGASTDLFSALDRFIAEVRHYSGDADADALVKALRALDLEGDYNPHATAAFDAILWIISQPRPLVERLKALTKFCLQRGQITIRSMKAFCGWE